MAGEELKKRTLDELMKDASIAIQLCGSLNKMTAAMNPSLWVLKSSEYKDTYERGFELCSSVIAELCEEVERGRSSKPSAKSE